MPYVPSYYPKYCDARYFWERAKPLGDKEYIKDIAGKRYRLIVYYTKPPLWIKGPYKEKPKPPDPLTLLSRWKKGENWSRMQCLDSRSPFYKQWFWVIQQCKIEEIGPSPPTGCTLSDFAHPDWGKKTYTRVCNGETITIEVDYTKPISATLYGPNMPPERTKEEMCEGWRAGWEITREKCSKDNMWYWVKYPAKIITLPGEEAPPEEEGVPEEGLVEKIKREPWVWVAVGSFVVIGVIAAYYLLKD